MSEVDLSNYTLIPTEEAITTTKEQIVGLENSLINSDLSINQDILQAAIQLGFAVSEDSSKFITGSKIAIAYFLIDFFNSRLFPKVQIEVLKQHIKEYEEDYYRLQQNL